MSKSHSCVHIEKKPGQGDGEKEEEKAEKLKLASCSLKVVNIQWEASRMLNGTMNSK